MAAEVRSKGAKLEIVLAPSTKKKLAARARKNKTSMSQIGRDLIQAYLKK